MDNVLNVNKIEFSIRDHFIGKEEGAFNLEIPMVHLHIGPLDINLGTVRDLDDLILELKTIRKEASQVIEGEM